MKCDLAGLLANAANALGENYADPEMRRYYAESLREVANHIQDVRDGVHTPDQWVDHYCVRPGYRATRLPRPTKRVGGIGK